MATAAQILDKSATPYQKLIWRIADGFTYDDSPIRPQDLPALTDDDMAVVLNHETGIGFDAARPIAYAEILNSSVYVTQIERDAALAQNLRAALTFEIRDFLCGDIDMELYHRSEPVADPAAQAMDEAGHCAADFA